METVNTIMEMLESSSNLIADAIIRRTMPCEDDISETKARELYGAKWLRRMKRDGLAKYSRIGSRNVFSRHQLDCLRAAEREHAKLIYARLEKK